MNIIFMGTPTIAVEPLHALYQCGKHSVQVVTKPDRPVGRKRIITPPPVKVFAAEHNLPVWQPANVNSMEFLAVLKDAHPDLIVIVAFGQILSKDLLAIPKYGVINLHASLLPLYRGPSPVRSAVLNGERFTGVTIMNVSTKMDAGDILAQEKTQIGPDETAGELQLRLTSIGSVLLVKTIDAIERGDIEPVQQDESQATYTKKFEKSDGIINWNAPAASVHNFIRAMRPWPGAFTFLARENKAPLKIEIVRGSPLTTEKTPSCEPGTVTKVTKDVVEVCVADGMYALHEVKPENKKAMNIGDFINGYAVSPGTTFIDRK